MALSYEMIGRRGALALALFHVAYVGVACRDYELAYSPNNDAQALHMRFDVQQPSKADLLFVIDNSKSMLEEQEALATSIDQLLQTLAPQDTRYRIGVVSTDNTGFSQDCCGESIEAPFGGGNVGNCIRPPKDQPQLRGCDCNAVAPNATCGVTLRRPHDGVRGRLIAAFDDSVFDADVLAQTYGLNDTEKAAVASLIPTAVDDGPVWDDGQKGARFVIDREIFTRQACNACGCTECTSGNACVVACADKVAETLVKAFFLSNVRGLGVGGSGWEEGLEASLLAVGIDPEEVTDAAAIKPAYDLTATGGANQFPVRQTNGTIISEPWTRSDAMLAVMYVSDEEDCSMPQAVYQERNSFEEGAVPPQPTGSMCYQDAAQAQFWSLSRVHDLLAAKKSSAKRVAIGFIGGARQTGLPPHVGRDAEADDCRVAGTGASNECACLAAEVQQDFDNRWCQYSISSDRSLAACQALAGWRYVALANMFTRRTFDAICQSGATAFGPALADFAQIATRACFDLTGVYPIAENPEAIVVKRRAFGVAGELEILPRLADSTSAGVGWYYDAQGNQICLLGLDRIIGDTYDISILYKDQRDYKH